MTTEFIVSHLWQSSCFAVLAGFQAFALRKNPPKVRYWVWLSASLKFLVPWALLVSLGDAIPWTAQSTISLQAPVLTSTLVQIAEPFSTNSYSTVSAPAPMHWMPVTIGVVWALGFLTITLVRCRSWFRIRAALRASTPVELPIPVPVFIASGAAEPGIVGFLRPVLVLPAQLLERLNPRQLDAVLAHELCHVRRRDNFFAAIHMVVEAIFWFHPLVWWIGSRLLEERELACDEEVLRMGCEPTDYVEGILKVCRFYTESPLTCVSGVTGADVKKRLRTILAGSIARELNFGKKVVLAVAGLAALAVPIVVGIMHGPVILAQSPVHSQPPTVDRAVPVQAPRTIAQQTAKAPAPAKSPVQQPPAMVDWQTAAGGKLAFEVASVKRGEFVPPTFSLDVGDSFKATGGRFIANFPLLQFIMFAYKFAPSADQRQAWTTQVPDWARSTANRFTIEGKAESNNPTKDQFRLMMQSLLAERFKVAVHFETQQGPMLALTLVKPGKLGPKLHPHEEGPPCDAPAADVWPEMCGAYGARPAPDGVQMQNGSRNVTMPYLAQVLTGTGAADRPVVDQTGLSGTFDFTFEHRAGGVMAQVAGIQPDPQGLQGATVLEAIRDQLGLKLESTRGPIQVLVIDHVELPSEN